jgi:hypothetical protein
MRKILKKDVKKLIKDEGVSLIDSITFLHHRHNCNNEKLKKEAVYFTKEDVQDCMILFYDLKEKCND